MVPKHKININYIFLCIFIMYSSLLWGLGCVCLFYYNQSINHFHLCRSLLLSPMVLWLCGRCLLWGIFYHFGWFVFACFGPFLTLVFLGIYFRQATVVLLYKAFVVKRDIFIQANM